MKIFSIILLWIIIENISFDSVSRTFTYFEPDGLNVLRKITIEENSQQ